MQCSTHYNQSYSRKIQIDNAFYNEYISSSNVFFKLFIYNISDFHVSIFRNVCLKIINFHYLSKNRQIHVIKRYQLMLFMPLFYNGIK